MARKRLENLAPERRRALFDAAAEEFVAHGFEGASLNRIIKTAGLGKSSLYYYFDDKADLFATVLESALDAVFGEIGGFAIDELDRETFWDALDEYYKKVAKHTRDNEWFIGFGTLFYEVLGDPKLAPGVAGVLSSIRTRIEELILHGQGLGVVRSDIPNGVLTDAAMGLFEALDRSAVANWSELSDEDRDQLASVHMVLFRDLLAAK